jgi:hypothetical protein
MNKQFIFFDENYSLLKSIIGSLHNLSKTINFDDDMNATSILIAIAHRLKSHEQSMYLMSIYITLANTLHDKDIEELPDTVMIIRKLVQIISRAAELMAKSEHAASSRMRLRRLKIELDNDQVEDVCTIVDEDGIQWDIIELLNGLYRIAVNDKIKYHIYGECNMEEHLIKIVNAGNLIEKEYAFKLIYQLSFDEKISEMIRVNEQLQSALKKFAEADALGTENELKHFRLHEYCKGIKWNVENKLKVSGGAHGHGRGSYAHGHGGAMSPLGVADMQLSSKSARLLANASAAERGADAVDYSKYKLMISYNCQSRDLCLKIKHSLEQIGFKIWIDVCSFLFLTFSLFSLGHFKS